MKISELEGGRVLRRTFLVNTGLLFLNCGGPIFITEQAVDVLFVVILGPPP
jgi:hypothetical protein